MQITGSDVQPTNASDGSMKPDNTNNNNNNSNNNNLKKSRRRTYLRRMETYRVGFLPQFLGGILMRGAIRFTQPPLPAL